MAHMSSTSPVLHEISGKHICTDVHGHQRMNPTDFGESLTLHVAMQLGLNSKLGYDSWFWV